MPVNESSELSRVTYHGDIVIPILIGKGLYAVGGDKGISEDRHILLGNFEQSNVKRRVNMVSHKIGRARGFISKDNLKAV